MWSYLLEYKYVGESEVHAKEGISVSYLKDKIRELASMSQKSIEYTIYEVKDKGVEEYNPDKY